MVRKIKIGKIEMNFSDRWLYTFIALGVVILLGIIVYAVAPNPGHELSEIDLPSCSDGQVLGMSGDSWGCTTVSSGDNLGNHIATQNIQLNNNWLSGDGGNEGIYIDANGNVGIGTTTPGAKLDVNGGIRVDIVSGSRASTGDIPALMGMFNGPPCSSANEGEIRVLRLNVRNGVYDGICHCMPWGPPTYIWECVY